MHYLMNIFSKKNCNPGEPQISEQGSTPPVFFTPPSKEANPQTKRLSLFSKTWAPENVTKVKIDVSGWEGKYKYVLCLHGMLTEEECEKFKGVTEDKGYGEALLNVGGGREIQAHDVRKSDRCIIDDEEAADALWQRILAVSQDDDDLLHASFVGNKPYNLKAVGLNERLRFLRYDKGHYFLPHVDGCYVRTGDPSDPRYMDRSYVTCQLYLNEGFTGGATSLMGRDYSNQVAHAVVPKTGMVLLFQHDVYHEGSLLIEGRKYAMRTDVMYHRVEKDDKEENESAI